MRDLQRLTRVSVLAAMAAVMMFNIQVQLVPAAPFLTYDPSDVPVLIGGFALGPAAGITVAAFKDLLYLVLHPSPWSYVGVPMSFMASASMAWTAASLYWLHKTRARAIRALVLGGVVSIGVMALANWLVLPLFFRWFSLPVPADMAHYLVAAVVPFNLLRCAINGTLTFLIYKRVSPFLKRREAPTWVSPSSKKDA